MTPVSVLLNRVKTILQETGPGVRWTDQELVDWIGESYAAIVQVKPDANAVNVTHTCVKGTKQALAVGEHRLIDIPRNKEGMAITLVDRGQLDTARRNWHRMEPEDEAQHFVYDENDPRTFYLYPPVVDGHEVDKVVAVVPESHDYPLEDDPESRLSSAYDPVVIDYVLYRAFSKDSDDGANAERSLMHYRAWNEALGRKVHTDMTTSPNRRRE